MEDETNILINILLIGRKYLDERKDISIDELREVLKDKYGERDNKLIERALSLFFPENFKNYYGEGAWLSSDGHIRLLQYESLKSSEKNLILAKDSLEKSEEGNALTRDTLNIAIQTLNATTESLEKAEKSLSFARKTFKVSIFALFAAVIVPVGLELFGRFVFDNESLKSKELKDQEKIRLLGEMITSQKAVLFEIKERKRTCGSISKQCHEKGVYKKLIKKTSFDFCSMFDCLILSGEWVAE